MEFINTLLSLLPDELDQKLDKNTIKELKKVSKKFEKLEFCIAHIGNDLIQIVENHVSEKVKSKKRYKNQIEEAKKEIDNFRDDIWGWSVVVKRPTHKRDPKGNVVLSTGDEALRELLKD